MNKKKIVMVLVAVLAAAGGVYKLVLAKPAEPKHKIEGEVYVLPKEFLVNLRDERIAKLGVGLVLKAGHAAGAAHGGAPPPEGYGALPQEAVVRDLVTDTLTGVAAEELRSRRGRRELKRELLHAIEAETDVEATRVLLMDVAVQ